MLIVVVFPLSLCLCTAGKPLPYMPYDMKLALDQEPHSGRPGSPYRLSPRDLSKVPPQPDPNAPSVSRYSVPPGNRTRLHPFPSLHSWLPPSLANVTYGGEWYWRGIWERLPVARSVGGLSCSLVLLGIYRLIAMLFCQSFSIFPSLPSLSMGLSETLLYCRRGCDIIVFSLPPVLCFVMLLFSEGEVMD